MSRHVRFSARAAAYLNREIVYLAERNPAAARRLLARIEETRTLLREYPEAGPPSLIPGARRLVVDAYVLTYVVRRGSIEIAAVRHGRQREPEDPAD
jgi:toxin ParE1/3/4